MVEPIDVIFISGNGANEKTLIEAGAKDADLIVSTTNADELMYYAVLWQNVWNKTFYSKSPES